MLTVLPKALLDLSKSEENVCSLSFFNNLTRSSFFNCFSINFSNRFFFFDVSFPVGASGNAPRSSGFAMVPSSGPDGPFSPGIMTSGIVEALAE